MPSTISAASVRSDSVMLTKRATPPLLELEKMLSASHAVEMGQETAEDLTYLQGKHTSLGGMRAKSGEGLFSTT